MPSNKRQKKLTDGFRFNAKKVGLTYSAPVEKADNPIPGTAKLQEFLEEKIGFGKYIVAEEKHESGKRHYHVWYHADQKMDTQNVRFFDWEYYHDGQKRYLHPNIVNKPGCGWIHYCKKDKQYITNIEESHWKTALEFPTASAAVDYLWQTEPKEMTVRGAQIKANLTDKMTPAAEPVLYYGPYPKAYHEFEQDPATHALLLWGPPGQNKTQFARYLMAHRHGPHYFNKKSVETLKRRPATMPFIFDEVYFADRDPEDSKEITDVENGGNIEKCRYGALEIPPGVPRIFTSNYEFPFKNPKEAVYGRRVVSKYIGPDM